MSKILKIRDLTLRDGQQSMLATRMSQKQIDRVIDLFKEAGFYAMEVWGGAVPDSIMRYLNEDPWYRLEKIKEVIGDTSKLTALSRGRNLFGYNPYPEEVIEGFNRLAVKSGIDIMRVFDCLNDINNMKSTIKYVKENGGLVDCAVCYTIDPKYRLMQKYQRLLRGKSISQNVFTIDYYVNLAKELETLGADMISIKDMAGLITPSKTKNIIQKLKENISLPIDFHTHCTPGYGLASCLMAMISGADIIDTNIMTFAGGPAAPAIELLYIFAKKLNIDIDLNFDVIFRIDQELRTIRKELAEFDTSPRFPKEFNPQRDVLPKEVEILFDLAIEYAQNDKEVDLISTTHEIEAWFNFDAPLNEVKNAEIPGGMYTNMLAQLKQLKLEHLLYKVLEMVPEVRVDSGCPPLVTPTSQIVGAQAVNCVIALNKGENKYSNISTQFDNLVKGWYGKTPVPIEPSFRKMICGHSDEQPFDTSKYKRPENTVIMVEEYTRQLAENEKELLLLDLFPAVATGFLTQKKEHELYAIVRGIEEEQHRIAEQHRNKYKSLTPEQKRIRLEKGLSNYDWGSITENSEISNFEEELYKEVVN